MSNLTVLPKNKVPNVTTAVNLATSPRTVPKLLFLVLVLPALLLLLLLQRESSLPRPMEPLVTSAVVQTTLPEIAKLVSSSVTLVVSLATSPRIAILLPLLPLLASPRLVTTVERLVTSPRIVQMPKCRLLMWCFVEWSPRGFPHAMLKLML